MAISKQLTALAVLAIATVGLFSYVFAVFTGGTETSIETTLSLAYEEFNADRFENARGIAVAQESSPDWTDLQRSQHDFVIGASDVAIALAKDDPVDRRVELSEALPRLNLALGRGFPEGYATFGYRLLGLGNFATGDFPAAVTHLTACLESSFADRRRLLPKLAEAQLRASSGKPAIALKTIDQYLALNTIGREERARGNLLKGRIHAKQKLWDKALRALKLAGDDTTINNEVLLGLAKIKLGRADQMIKMLPRGKQMPPQVTDLLQEVVSGCLDIARMASERIGLDATLVAAQAKRLAGQTEHALALYSSVRQNRTDLSASVTAGLEELELLSESYPASESLSTAIFLVREISDPRRFDPRLISLKEFRDRVTQSVGRLRSRGEYQVAIDLAQSLVPVFSEAKSMQMEAVAYDAWAADVAKSAGRNNVESRKLRLLAGERFTQAADLMFESAEYPSYLWDAIIQFEKAQLYERSLQLLEPYLRYEQRDRVPRGLVMQGKSRLALGQFEAALQSFETCIIDFPRDSLIYTARVQAARATAGLGRLTEARDLLEDNLMDGLLEPSSSVWRESLFVLCETLFNEAQANHFAIVTPSPDRAPLDAKAEAARFQQNQELWEETILRLEEANLRYDDSPNSRRTKYLASQAHRYAARWPQLAGTIPDLLETARREAGAKLVAHLQAAVKSSRQLRDELNSMSGDQSLTPDEETMLRNCYLLEGDSLFDLGRLDDAIRVYSGAINRFIDEPIALEAMVQQVRCFESQNRKQDVQRVLKQAKQILERIPPESDELFAKTTRYDRKGWDEYLTWLSKT